MLKLMYITNRPDVAAIVENAGVDRIFIDLEYIGKADRQGGMDTVQSKHTLDDIKAVKAVLSRAELLVRINPIHEKNKKYCSSKEEIDEAIKNGADILMLPYFKTLKEVKAFLSFVGGRVKTMLLLETVEAAELVDDILTLQGIDFIHIGLNDLSLGYGKRFMFELLSDGTVEALCEKISKTDIKYGFGGIASIGKGILPAEMIIKEHYRLGSGCAILSRSFCNVDNFKALAEIKEIFDSGIKEIRQLESECEQKLKNQNNEYFTENKKLLKTVVDSIG